MLPLVTIEGRVVDDPELRFTPSGLALAKFRIVASSRKKNEQDEWVDDKTLWIDATCWRQLAENVAESIGKGDLITVVGRLQTEEWTNKEGEKRSKISVTADSVAASLQFRTIRHGEGKSASRSTSSRSDSDPWTGGRSSTPDDEPPF
jgi:single-strand DNA-binding protein